MWMRTSDEAVIGSVVNAAFTYKLNGVGVGVGHQRDWTGAFAANFPSGYKYLIGSTVATGASAPYYFARITESKITVTVTPDSSSTASFDVFLLPSFNASLNGVPKTQLREQKYVTYRSCGLNTSGKPTIMSSSIGVGKLIGKTTWQQDTDDGFLFTYNSDPTYLAYWQIFLGAQDGTSNIKFGIVVTVDHHFEFTLNLTTITSTPTLRLNSMQKQIDTLLEALSVKNRGVDPDGYLLVKKGSDCKSIVQL
jgi:hypothetical protein